MSNPASNVRVVHPPTGPELTARSWLTEAPMRMLMNNLHPEVAENPNELVVYGGAGSVASPNRETEAMRDGSDAVSDWPFLNALLNCASGATWVSIHHGGGVGMGYSQHAGMVICCDGTEEAARRIERVLWNDPATGVMRHADAGYEAAIDCAREHGLVLPGILD